MVCAVACRRAGLGLMLLGLASCSTSAGATRAGSTPSPAPAELAAQNTDAGFVAAVNVRCAALDRAKTALYRDALADGTLTIPEYLIAESAYRSTAHSFDAAVAAVPAKTAADARAGTVLAAYEAWVEGRRQPLRATAERGDEAAFEAALQQSNAGFLDAEPVQAMKAQGFIPACLSR